MRYRTEDYVGSIIDMRIASRPPELGIRVWRSMHGGFQLETEVSRGEPECGQNPGNKACNAMFEFDAAIEEEWG
jgi:hypothetical protein